MTPLVPIGAALLGLGALAWYGKKAKATTPPPGTPGGSKVSAEAAAAAYTLGYTAGCAQGTEDGAAKLPQSIPNGSIDPVKKGADLSGSPADYIRGYVDGNNDCWKTATKKATPYGVTPPAGSGSEGTGTPDENAGFAAAAYGAGQLDGKFAGATDGAADGIDEFPPHPNPSPDPSATGFYKTNYERGFVDAYNYAYAEAQNKKKAEKAAALKGVSNAIAAGAAKGASDGARDGAEDPPRTPAHPNCPVPASYPGPYCDAYTNAYNKAFSDAMMPRTAGYGAAGWSTGKVSLAAVSDIPQVLQPLFPPHEPARLQPGRKMALPLGGGMYRHSDGRVDTDPYDDSVRISDFENDSVRISDVENVVHDAPQHLLQTEPAGMRQHPMMQRQASASASAAHTNLHPAGKVSLGAVSKIEDPSVIAAREHKNGYAFGYQDGKNNFINSAGTGTNRNLSGVSAEYRDGYATGFKRGQYELGFQRGTQKCNTAPRSKYGYVTSDKQKFQMDGDLHTTEAIKGFSDGAQAAHCWYSDSDKAWIASSQPPKTSGHTTGKVSMAAVSKITQQPQPATANVDFLAETVDDFPVGSGRTQTVATSRGRKMALPLGGGMYRHSDGRVDTDPYDDSVRISDFENDSVRISDFENVVHDAPQHLLQTEPAGMRQYPIMGRATARQPAGALGTSPDFESGRRAGLDSCRAGAGGLSVDAWNSLMKMSPDFRKGFDQGREDGGCVGLAMLGVRLHGMDGNPEYEAGSRLGERDCDNHFKRHTLPPGASITFYNGYLAGMKRGGCSSSLTTVPITTPWGTRVSGDGDHVGKISLSAVSKIGQSPMGATGMVPEHATQAGDDNVARQFPRDLLRSTPKDVQLQRVSPEYEAGRYAGLQACKGIASQYIDVNKTSRDFQHGYAKGVQEGGCVMPGRPLQFGGRVQASEGTPAPTNPTPAEEYRNGYAWGAADCKANFRRALAAGVDPNFAAGYNAGRTSCQLPIGGAPSIPTDTRVRGTHVGQGHFTSPNLPSSFQAWSPSNPSADALRLQPRHPMMRRFY